MSFFNETIKLIQDDVICVASRMKKQKNLIVFIDLPV